jgi:hypothetical protein
MSQRGMWKEGGALWGPAEGAGILRLRRRWRSGCAQDDRLEEGWIYGTTEVVPFPFLLHAGAVVAQADNRFLGASLLGMTRGYFSE